MVFCDFCNTFQGPWPSRGRVLRKLGSLSGFEGEIMVNLRQLKIVVINETHSWESVSKRTGSREEAVRGKLTSN